MREGGGVTSQKLSFALIDKLTTALKLGMPVARVVRLCGCSESAYYGWLKAGREDETESTLEWSLVQAVSRAKEEGEVALLDSLRRHSDVDWRAGAWLLSRVHGYTETRALEITGRDGGPVQSQVQLVDVSGLSVEQLEALAGDGDGE